MSSSLQPRANPVLLGHGRQERILRVAAESHHLHHAWLMTGPSGVGKATLAFRFARALLAGFPGVCLDVSQTHPAFGQVAAGTHTDLLTIERGWDEKRQRVRAGMVVDDARHALEHFALTPASGSWRVVVVDGADYLNANAANLLLKLLEEPPDRSVFLLTSSSPGSLLRTLRSRCITLQLRRPDPERRLRSTSPHIDPVLDQRRQSMPRTASSGSWSNARPARRDVSDSDSLVVFDENAGSEDGERGRPLSGGPAFQGSHLTEEAIATIEEAFRSRVLNQAPAVALSKRHPDVEMTHWYDRRSELLRLIAATDQFNLDKQQLAVEINRAVRS